MFNFIDIYIFIPVSGCVGRGPRALLCPGTYNAVKTALPRRCGRQTTRANHPTETPKLYWRISLYNPFLDHLITELESCLLKSENSFHAQHLLPRAVKELKIKSLNI